MRVSRVPQCRKPKVFRGTNLLRPSVASRTVPVKQIHLSFRLGLCNRLGGDNLSELSANYQPPADKTGTAGCEAHPSRSPPGPDEPASRPEPGGPASRPKKPASGATPPAPLTPARRRPETGPSCPGGSANNLSSGSEASSSRDARPVYRLLAEPASGQTVLRFRGGLVLRFRGGPIRKCRGGPIIRQFRGGPLQ